MIKLPTYCPRGKIKICVPLDQIVSDCGTTFICAGLDRSEDNKDGDIFRVCFKSVDTDTEYMLNHTDIFDQIAVMSRAVAIEDRVDSPPRKKTNERRY